MFARAKRSREQIGSRKQTGSCEQNGSCELSGSREQMARASKLSSHERISLHEHILLARATSVRPSPSLARGRFSGILSFNRLRPLAPLCLPPFTPSGSTKRGEEEEGRESRRESHDHVRGGTHLASTAEQLRRRGGGGERGQLLFEKSRRTLTVGVEGGWVSWF